MIVTLLALSLAGSGAAWPLCRLVKRTGVGWIVALVPAGLFASFIRFAPVIERGETITERLPWAPSLGVELAFRLDGFAYVFCLLITGIGVLVVIYASAYLVDRSWRDRARFLALILLFMTAMLGAVLSDDLVVLFVFWEATSVVSFLLIGFDVDSPSARRSALMSLRVTAGGGLALLAAILLIGATLGTYSMTTTLARAGELARGPYAVPILAGILVGGFTKSAQFPFHFWLPNAMQAPTPASAYLHSATMVKLGIYLLARFEPVIAAVPNGRDVLITVAMVTMLVGAYQALRAENYKAVLAYSTVASLGILVMLVALDGPMASVATVGFLLAHALYKATLFLCAGTVIHATGLTKLRQMGGLVRFLPVTAVASVLASLSMAGLPPFLGFISKEFLFEAQIQSSWNALPMAVAILVNAVIVGVAGVVTLRPFFMGRGRVREVRHREVLELLVGPLVLALLGLFISLQPGWVSRVMLRPAASAIYGRPVDVTVALWHGASPLLLVSAAVVGVGALLFVYWTPIHHRLRSQSALDRYEAQHAYDALLRGVDDLSSRIASRLQRADLRGHQRVILMSVGAFVLWGVLATGTPVRRGVEWADLRVGPALLAVVVLAGGIAAARARSLVTAMVASGLAGLVTALTFTLNGAPDLALTQFAVESLVVVLLTGALLVLPLRAPATRTQRTQRLDATLAGAVSLVLFLALLDVTARPKPMGASEFFGARSFVDAFGRNVVNVILVDFRGFDTLGETTVIVASAIIAWSLLGPRLPHDARFLAPSRPAPFVLVMAAPVFYWLLLTLSVVVLLRGHNEIGGGFVGGLTGALAFAIIALAHGVSRARAKLRWHPLVLAGGGLLLAVTSGLPGLVMYGDYLRHIWIEANIFGLHVKQGTTLLFDFGVYLAVLGTVLAFLFGLSRQAER